MRITAEPRSDQWNADDFMAGPRTFTIANVTPGKAEQKYDIELVEGEGRAWRPPLTMLRLLIAAWGDRAEDWKGRRVTLYRDPKVRFGKDLVGGIRISHVSHIDKPLRVPLTESRGKRGIFTVEPLPDAPVSPAQAATSTPPSAAPADEAAADQPTPEQIAASTNEKELRAWWETGTPETRAQINARVNELRARAGESQ